MEEHIWDYPPYPYLEQVLRHTPRSGLLYLELWRMQDEAGLVLVEKELLEQTLLMHPMTFKCNLMGLCMEGVCSMRQNDEFYFVDMLGWDDENA